MEDPLEVFISSTKGITRTKSRKIITSCIAKVSKTLGVSPSIIKSVVQQDESFVLLKESLSPPALTAEGLNVDDVIATGKLLGEGAHGSVYLYNGFAVKLLSTEHEDYTIEDITREIAVMKKLSQYPQCHRHIVCLHDSFHQPLANTYNIIMYPIEGLTLAEYYTTRLNYEQAISLTIQSIEGLRYIHSHNVYHNDIHEGNMMMTYEGLIKYIDFGHACIGHCFRSGAPTPENTEQGQPSAKWYDNNGWLYPGQGDIFSLGITLFRIIHQRNVINFEIGNFRWFRKILPMSGITWPSGNPSFSFNVKTLCILNTSEKWKRLYDDLDLMLMLDPRDRIMPSIIT